jgi:hypothetical protein
VKDIVKLMHEHEFPYITENDVFFDYGFKTKRFMRIALVMFRTDLDANELLKKKKVGKI